MDTNTSINGILYYSGNSLEHLARQTAKRYLEKQYQHSGLLFFKQLADSVTTANALYKNSGDTVKTNRRKADGIITGQVVDKTTSDGIERGNVNNTLAADFINAAFESMLAAHRYLSAFAAAENIILTPEQVRLYLIKRGAYACGQLNRQEFPRHSDDYKQAFVRFTDIDAQTDISAPDTLENIIDNDTLRRLMLILNERERLVIVRHYIGGYSYKSIALDNTDIFTNANAVKLIAKRAIDKMRAAAEKNGFNG